jgi:hypothetical protein
MLNLYLFNILISVSKQTKMYNFKHGPLQPCFLDDLLRYRAQIAFIALFSRIFDNILHYKVHVEVVRLFLISITWHSNVSILFILHGVR